METLDRRNAVVEAAIEAVRVSRDIGRYAPESAEYREVIRKDVIARHNLTVAVNTFLKEE